MVSSSHNSPLFDMYRFLPGADTVSKMINFSRWEQPPSGKWLPIVTAPDVVSQEPKLPTATKLLNQNIGMHAIPVLNQNINLQLCIAPWFIFKISWPRLENAICNRHSLHTYTDIQSRKATLLDYPIPESSRY